MINLSTCAFEARAAMRAESFAVSHAQALELGVSLLGYGSLAALKVDQPLAPQQMFAAAEHIVLIAVDLPKRMSELGLNASHSELVAKAFVESFRVERQGSSEGLQIHASFEDFEDFISQDVQERAWDDDYVVSVYSETNASIDEFYVDSFESEPLHAENGQWVLKASGTHTGESDPDRLYYGHAGNFLATYVFEKVGRCGLVEVDLSFALDFDRSYV